MYKFLTRVLREKYSFHKIAEKQTKQENHQTFATHQSYGDAPKLVHRNGPIFVVVIHLGP